jgi:hypothetical protein
LDVIQRLEPVIIELERQRSPVVVIARQVSTYPTLNPKPPVSPNHIRYKKPWKHLPNSLHRIKRLETSNNSLSHVRIPHVD